MCWVISVFDQLPKLTPYYTKICQILANSFFRLVDALFTGFTSRVSKTSKNQKQAMFLTPSIGALTGAYREKSHSSPAFSLFEKHPFSLHGYCHCVHLAKTGQKQPCNPMYTWTKK